MKDLTTRHLTIFTLICVATEAVLLSLTTAAWWHRALVIPPVVVMALGASFVMAMRNGKMEGMKALVIYKAVKLVVVTAMVVLFVGLAGATKMQNIAFLIVSFLSYLLTLAAETYIYVEYQKNKANEAKGL